MKPSLSQGAQGTERLALMGFMPVAYADSDLRKEGTEDDGVLVFEHEITAASPCEIHSKAWIFANELKRRSTAPKVLVY